MAEEVNMEQAKKVYETLTKMLDNIGWHYEKHEDELLIKSTTIGEDLPIDFIVVVNPKSEVVQLLSWMPFEMAEEKRIDGAIAVCVANNGLVNGSFDYDISTGRITFRMTSSYRESILGEEMFKYMIIVSASTVDQYNDKFLMLSKGAMTIQQFIEQENAQ